MRKTQKKEVGTKLVYKRTNRVCTLISINDTNFSVKYEDNGDEKVYSIGSLGSKFNLVPIVPVDETLEAKKIRELQKENSMLKKQINELQKELAELKEYNSKLLTAFDSKHKGGRPRKFTDETDIINQMIELYNQGESYRQIAKKFGCGVNYVFTRIKQNKDRLS